MGGGSEMVGWRGGEMVVSGRGGEMVRGGRGGDTGELVLGDNSELWRGKLCIEWGENTENRENRLKIKNKV